MKTIYLLRHAKSSWKNPTLADFDRPLNKRGKSAAKIMAAHLADRKLKPDLILCSAAKRTVSTLKSVRSQLGTDLPAIVDEAFYHAGVGEMVRNLRALDDDVGSVLLIGHNPGMEDLAHFLVGGGDEEAYSRMVIKFPTAALAVFHADITDWKKIERDGAKLISFVCPRDLE